MPNYEPMILFNPTDKVIEFRVGGEIFIFQPKEKRNMDGFVAWQVLHHQNTGLIEYDFNNPPVTQEDSVDYDTMPWRKLVSIASKEGLFKAGAGTSRDEVVRRLKEAHGQTN